VLLGYLLNSPVVEGLCEVFQQNFGVQIGGSRHLASEFE